MKIIYQLGDPDNPELELTAEEQQAYSKFKKSKFGAIRKKNKQAKKSRRRNRR